MIPTVQIASLVQSLYDNGPFDWKGDVSGVYLGVKELEDTHVIVLRGSWTFQDWVKNFMAVANPIESYGLGPVHPGFDLGMEDVTNFVIEKTGPNRIISGHSLGAGRTAILTGKLVLKGQPPLKRIQFGEPKPGFDRLASVIKDVPCENYRNGNGFKHDLVTDVPLTFPPEMYTHSYQLTYVNAPPPENDEWGPFAWHHFPLYLKAMEAQA